VQDIVALWGISEREVIRIFGEEGRILHLGSRDTRLRKPHNVLRVPQRVLIRVFSPEQEAGQVTYQGAGCAGHILRLLADNWS
jgi:hypothetical protein